VFLFRSVRYNYEPCIIIQDAECLNRSYGNSVTCYESSEGGVRSCFNVRSVGASSNAVDTQECPPRNICPTFRSLPAYYAILGEIIPIRFNEYYLRQAQLKYLVSYWTYFDEILHPSWSLLVRNKHNCIQKMHRFLNWFLWIVIIFLFYYIQCI
jgi:hypothetical protein